MKKVLFSLLLLGLTACQNNQKNQPSEAEIEQMVNERVEAKMAENGQATNTMTDSHEESSTRDNSTSHTENRMEAMYEA